MCALTGTKKVKSRAAARLLLLLLLLLLCTNSTAVTGLGSLLREIISATAQRVLWWTHLNTWQHSVYPIRMWMFERVKG